MINYLKKKIIYVKCFNKRFVDKKEAGRYHNETF